MKLELSIEDALYLEAGLKLSGVKETFNGMVKTYCDLTGESEEEARSMMFPDFARALINRVKEMSADKVMPK